MARSWSILLLVREATRNISAARSRLFLLLLAAVAMGSSCAAFSAVEAGDFLHRVEGLEGAGAGVVTFGAASSRDHVRISRSSCEALSTVPGVQRAGVLLAERSSDISELGARVAVFTASGTLFPGLRNADGLRGSELSPGGQRSFATLSRGDVRGLAPAPAQPEGIPTNRAIVLPLSPGVASAPACIAVLDRFEPVQTVSIDLVSQLDVQGGVVEAVPTLHPTSDPVDDWRTRTSRLVGPPTSPAVGLVGGLATSLLTWTRSAEVAAYRLSGTRRRSTAILLTVEALALGGAFTLAGSVAAVVLQGAYVSVAEVLLRLVAGGTAWAVGSSLGVVRSVLVSPATLARDR